MITSSVIRFQEDKVMWRNQVQLDWQALTYSVSHI